MLFGDVLVDVGLEDVVTQLDSPTGTEGGTGAGQMQG